MIRVTSTTSCTSLCSIFEFLLACLTNLDIWHSHHLCRHLRIHRWWPYKNLFQVISTNLIGCNHSLGKWSLLRHVKQFVRCNLLLQFCFLFTSFCASSLVNVVMLWNKLAWVCIVNVNCLSWVFYMHFS